MQHCELGEWMSYAGSSLPGGKWLWRALAVFGVVAVCSGGAYGVPCTFDAECVDGLYCTNDVCMWPGETFSYCLNAPIHARCTDSVFCDGPEWCDARRCIGGTKDNAMCAIPADCPGGVCGPLCVGGTNDGDYCGKQADCPGGVCDGLGSGTCYECIPGVPCDRVECTAPEFCSETYGRCVGCEIDNDCDDDNTCNGYESCNLADFTCLPGTPMDCSTLNDGCNDGVCNPVSGQCERDPKPDGTFCDDDDRCTAVSACQNGVCVGGPNPEGCVRLELRVPLSQQEIKVGDILRLSLYAVYVPGLYCSGTEAELAGMDVAISWDPAILQLAPPSEIGESNPEDPCNSTDSCYNCGCAFDPHVTCYKYNWAASGLPNDCEVDGLNSPCYPQFPANDGDAYYANLAYINSPCICHGGIHDGYACSTGCTGGTCGPIRALASTGGLWVTNLKFKAIASSDGQPTFVALEDCIGQTRTSVAGVGQQGAGDILKEISPPGPVMVLGCEPPTVAAEGCRYVAVTPAAGSTGVALRVAGVSPTPPGEADVSCVQQYVQADGKLGSSPVYQTPTQWGTVHVRGDKLRSGGGPTWVGGSYNIQSDCKQSAPGTDLSDAISAKPWRWGDTNVDNVVDFVDITRVVDGFRSVWDNHGRPCTTDAQCTTVLPHKKCNTVTGYCVAITLENVDVYGGAGCAPDRLVDFVDITREVDAFIGKPYPCPPCP